MQLQTLLSLIHVINFLLKKPAQQMEQLALMLQNVIHINKQIVFWALMVIVPMIQPINYADLKFALIIRLPQVHPVPLQQLI